MIEKYLYLCGTESYSKIASIILAQNPEISLSHRTLRRQIAKLHKKEDMSSEQKEVVETDGNKNYRYEGRTQITTKEEAIKFFNIDLNKERITKASYRCWDVTMKGDEGPIKRTNYSVRLETEMIINPFNYKKVYKDIDEAFKVKRTTKTENHSQTIVVALSDIHIGAKTTKAKGVINSKDFSLEHLIKYLKQTAERINNFKKGEVHLTILGDIVESITGLNHFNSWQGMEEDAFGANVVILAEKILGNFLENINNLKSVYIVGGNHDRIHPSKEVSDKGDVAKIVAYMLSKNFNVEYHPMVVSKEIDGVGYIMHHGDCGLSKQNLAKIILDYGVGTDYTVVLSGHTHSRQTKKEFYKQDTITQDSAKYRGITVAPLFTGNYYSESNGWTSSAGFSILEANASKTNINHYDIGL